MVKYTTYKGALIIFLCLKIVSTLIGGTRGGATTRASWGGRLGPCGRAPLPYTPELASVEGGVRLKMTAAARCCLFGTMKSMIGLAPETGPWPSSNGPTRRPASQPLGGRQPACPLGRFDAAPLLLRRATSPNRDPQIPPGARRAGHRRLPRLAASPRRPRFPFPLSRLAQSHPHL
jgi:hypothetical protein